MPTVRSKWGAVHRIFNKATQTLLITFIFVLFVALAIDHFLHTEHKKEAAFRQSIASRLEQTEAPISIADLVPAPWVMVCHFSQYSLRDQDWSLAHIGKITGKAIVSSTGLRLPNLWELPYRTAFVFISDDKVVEILSMKNDFVETTKARYMFYPSTDEPCIARADAVLIPSSDPRLTNKIIRMRRSL